MLAYRHSFHAGNHADVLKHIVQMAVLSYFNEKDKPYWIIDTHAGAGMYSLTSKHAQTKSEFEKGIFRLYERTDLPALVRHYVDLVRQFNLPPAPAEPAADQVVTRRSPSRALQAAAQAARTASKPVMYPGSPSISAAMLQSGDKLRLFELHPTDFTLLREHFAGQRSVSMQNVDGFAGLKATLPPPPRRAVILIDPSYELKEDYNHVYDALKDSLVRFPQGTYMVWYPVLNRPEWQRMMERMERLDVSWLNIALRIAEPDDQGFGMLGSGMFVINPPYVLEAQMREVMPYLVEHLGQFKRAEFLLRSFEPKRRK